tara:strand:- start:155 stop:799 length:645 start_codon:yes stop_codon:yes gene_type:complete
MASIDHFYVFTKIGAPEQQRLLERGLRVGVRRDHHGQGTSNVCFYFANCYLELLWLGDDKAAHNVMAKPLGLYERMRWRAHHASPFGLCVAPDSPDDEPPFASWDYRPEYLPEDMHIAMGCNSGVIGEPLLFQVSRPFEPFGDSHALSEYSLSRLVVTTPELAPMSLLKELEVERLDLQEGTEHLMEVTLQKGDAAPGDNELDLRPDLPLVLRW